MNNNNHRSHVETVTSAFEQPDWYVKGYAANIRMRCETVQTYIDQRPLTSVLDIGCGDGSLSLPLLSNTCQVTYLDLSSAMLEIVKKRVPEPLREQAHFVKGDLRQVDLAPASYDLILFVGVLAYVQNIREILVRLQKLVRPGGLIIAECTDASHFISRLNFGYRDLTGMLRSSKCDTFRHRGREVVSAFEHEGFKFRESFRHTYSVPIVSRFLNQDQTYSLMKRVYGSAQVPRRQRLGSELMMLFEAPK